MNSKPSILLILCFALLTKWVQSSIPAVTLNVTNLLTLQKGLGWPHDLYVAEGHDALLKIEHQWESNSVCEVTTPSGLKFNALTPPNNRYEKWSDGCGLRIHHVVEADEGRWRLTATTGTDVALGWTELFIKQDTTSYEGPEISLLDGETETQVELTTLNNSYCVVAQPFSESSLVPGHCLVTLGRATRAVQGNWNVLLGLPGRINELQVQRRVAVEAERLDVGYIRDSNTNKLHLYCNLLHTTKNITFCRFQKTSMPSGFNVIDGLSDGSHSYYGMGFFQRECGMTIEQPTAQDDGTWRCSVGVQQWVDTTIVQQSPLQALISVGPENTSQAPQKRLRTRRTTEKNREDEIETVFVQEDNTFTVMCRAEMSLAYCWFQHPNGSQFTPAALLDEHQPFWYTGENLQVGDCGITFAHATREEAGVWSCHMGPATHVGLEITNAIEVRVTGPLAANKREIATNVGDSITIYCHSSNGNRPLDYCRFLTPTAQGFRIDSTVSEDNALFDRYYFTPGRNLDYGDCSLTIKEIHEEDFGEWTCAAVINEDPSESRDTIRVYLDEIAPPPSTGLSQASVIGILAGTFGLVLILAGYAMYRLGWFSKVSNQQLIRPSFNQGEEIAMSSMASQRVDGSSQSSRSSVNSSEIEIPIEPRSEPRTEPEARVTT